MAHRRSKGSEDPPPRLRPATTPEEREKQLVALAMDLVEERMLAGTATSQETTHFLKLGSTREKLEQARLGKEIELQAAKVDQIASQGRMEELYKGAIDAMRTYGGKESSPEEELYDENLFRTETD